MPQRSLNGDVIKRLANGISWVRRESGKHYMPRRTVGLPTMVLHCRGCVPPHGHFLSALLHRRWTDTDVFHRHIHLDLDFVECVNVLHDIADDRVAVLCARMMGFFRRLEDGRVLLPCRI